MSVIGHTRVKRPRKVHSCFLCPVSIDIGEAHDRWAWVDENGLTPMRAHDACQRYAEIALDGWSNGDGLESDAVWDSVWDAVTTSDDDKYIMDEEKAAEFLEKWPGLARLAAKVRKQLEES